MGARASAVEPHAPGMPAIVPAFRLDDVAADAGCAAPCVVIASHAEMSVRPVRSSLALLTLGEARGHATRGRNKRCEFALVTNREATKHDDARPRQVASDTC